MVKHNICRKCDSIFPNHIYIDGKIKILNSRKYCLDCSPYNNHNTKILDKKTIDHRIVEIKLLEHCNELAELFGIILGDGCLYKPQNMLVITLNGIDEREYVKYVENLMKKVFGTNPNFKDLKSSKAVQLVIHSRNLFDQLISNGLSHGNKIDNQVSVPLWIKDNSEYSIACLKGLMDTDGSIYIKRSNTAHPSICVNFKNRSIRLLDDFKDICTSINVNAYKSGYNINIQSKRDVVKLINTVKPMKWQTFQKNNPKTEVLLSYKRQCDRIIN